MIIRHFEIKDIKALQKYRYPEKNDLEILSMINEYVILEIDYQMKFWGSLF